MKKILKIAKAITFLIVIISIFSCNNDDNILPQVNSGYTFTVIEDAGVVSFINVSEDATKYVWDFGDGTTSTEINPIKSFTTGTYNVVLTALNASGASDSFESGITILRRGPASLPLNFDEAAVKYNFAAFNGASFSIIANPDVSGANNVASKVGAITNIGAQFEGVTFDLATPINLTDDKSIKIKVWSNKVLDVLMKLENGTAGDIESIVSHRGSGWETLTFDYTSSANYSSLTIFIDGAGQTAGTFYIDAVMQIQTPAPLCTAESNETLSASGLNITFKSDLTANFINDGANFKWVTNPKSDTGINTSCKVGEITKLGNNPWDNNQIILDGKLDFNTNAGLKIKVYSAKAGFKVRVKLEDKANAGNNAELEVATTKTNEWEELTFPFASSQSGKFDKIVLFFDLNANNKDTYYFDDLKLYAGNGGGTSVVFDDGLLTNGDFELGNNSWTIGVGSDAAPVKTVSGNTYYSVNVTAAGNSYDVNVSQKLSIVQGSTYTLTFDAWSDRARSIIAGIGLSGGDFSNTVQTVNITKTQTRYTLTLSASNFGANDARVLFDLGSAVGEVNIDNVSLVLKTGGGSTGGTGTTFGLAQNGDFESGALSGWIAFQNGGTAILDNTVNNGGSWSGKLETNGPSNPAFKQEAVGAGTVRSGDKITIKFDVKGSVTQPGAVFNVLLFGEGAAGASFTKVFSPAPTVSGTWTTFIGSYTIASNADVSKGISFLIEAVCGGDAGCKVSANIDNVSVTIN